MSGIAAILGTHGSDRSNQQLALMLSATERGSGGWDVISTGAGSIGVTRFAWESQPGLSGPVGCLNDGTIAVVADATLYYDADLCVAIRAAGIEPRRESTATQRILEAYRAWGCEAPAHLEGDFAFLLWDGARHRLLAARSFSAKRPFYYWQGAGALCIASTIRGLLAAPNVHAPLEMPAVGVQAAGLSSNETETPFRGVNALAPGTTMIWSPGEQMILKRHWEPAQDSAIASLNFREAAVVLRGLLQAAVAERMQPGATTAVWMSGGWDSTAVFAAGQRAMESRGNAAQSRLRPVSWSYPDGDPGREDHWISATAERWNESPVWLDPYSSPVLGTPQQLRNAPRRDEPFSHFFENWNRSLARASLQFAGARVALDGNGGDQLFGASPHVLSDLFFKGQWGQLRKQWAERGGTGATLQDFIQTVVRPGIPRWALSPVSALRGKPVGYVAQRQIPPWMSESFSRDHDLLRRQRDREWAEYYCGPGQVGKGEQEFFFRCGEIDRYHATLSGFALAEGVELRSPLTDGRLVSFALMRPTDERLRGLETKRLLRAAMWGLLPEEVLAPRTHRTGTTEVYFMRSLASEMPAILESLGSRLLLDDAGIIDRRVYVEHWERTLRKGGAATAHVGQLYSTLQAELWLREQVGYNYSNREPTNTNYAVTAAPFAKVSIGAADDWFSVDTRSAVQRNSRISGVFAGDELPP